MLNVNALNTAILSNLRSPKINEQVEDKPDHNQSSLTMDIHKIKVIGNALLDLGVGIGSDTGTGQ